MKNRNYYQTQNKMPEININLKAFEELAPELENYTVNSTHCVLPKI